MRFLLFRYGAAFTHMLQENKVNRKQAKVDRLPMCGNYHWILRQSLSTEVAVQLFSPKLDQNTHEEKCWLLSSEELQKQSPRRVVLAINNPSHFEFALYQHGRESSVTLADSEKKGKSLRGGRGIVFFSYSQVAFSSR